MHPSTVSCSSDLTLKIWDTNNDWKNVKTLYGHDHSISSARFLPNDDFIVSASRDRTIRVWEVASGSVLTSAMSVWGWIAESLASAGSASRHSQGTANGCEESFPAQTADNSLAARWIRLVASLSATLARRVADIHLRLQTSRIWDAQTGETKSELRGHEHVVEVAVFAPIAAYAAIRELAGIAVRRFNTRMN